MTSQVFEVKTGRSADNEATPLKFWRKATSTRILYQPKHSTAHSYSSRRKRIDAFSEMQGDSKFTPQQSLFWGSYWIKKKNPKRKRMLELENKNPTKERKEENCENHGEQRIEADLCTGDLESSQSTAELQVRATEEKAGREGRRAKGGQPIVHLRLTTSLFVGEVSKKQW